jgi:hypothetical protein
LTGEFVAKAESKGYKVISSENYLSLKGEETVPELPSEAAK